MGDQLLGEIRMFAGTFAPTGWAFCQGQTLSIAQNSALYSLLGTAYGGDGYTNFKLPNLSGRVPVAAGQGNASNYVLGQSAGVESATLTAANMPAHNHSFAQNVSAAAATVLSPVNAIPAEVNTGQRGAPAYPAYSPSGSASGTLAAQTTGVAGSSVPFSVVQPYLAVNFIIALTGIYPTRP